MLPPKKVTISVDESDYQRLSDRLYHGQTTRLFRKLISAINVKIDQEGKAEINAFIEGESGLSLSQPKEEEA